MEIRAFCKEDTATLERMHRAQGFQYEFPDLDDPLNFLKIVGEENGCIVNAGIAHLTAEIFFLADNQTGTPRQRFDNLLTMERFGCQVAYQTGGLSDLHLWCPPEIEKAFGRRLLRLGWRRPLWTNYAKDLQG